MRAEIWLMSAMKRLRKLPEKIRGASPVQWAWATFLIVLIATSKSHMMTISMIVAACLGLWLGLEENRREALRTWNARGSMRSMLEYRVAVHESGHVICTVYNPLATAVNYATIDIRGEGHGQVEWSHIKQDEDKSSFLWHEIVTKLGGIAAERSEFNRFRATGSKDDLLTARTNAQRLVERGDLTPPWPTEPLPEDHFQMANNYARSVESGSECALVLDIAYQRAKTLIENNHDCLLHLAESLGENGKIDQEQIESVLAIHSVQSRFK